MVENEFIKKQYAVKGMSCASCAASLETYLGALDGVDTVTVNYANTTASIAYSPELVPQGKLEKSAVELGFELVIPEEYDALAESKERYTALKQKITVAMIFATPVFVISMFMQGVLPYEKWILLILSLPVVYYSGIDFIKNAIRRAIHFDSNMDTLVALSTQVAFWYSAAVTVFSSTMPYAHVYFESAVVIITFILLGKFLEERAKNKASEAIQKLASLQVKSVFVLDEGVEKEIAIEQVRKGNLLIVKPGEKIPVDGTVSSGASYIDEQMITGEPIAVYKSEGAKVKSGTINQDGKLIVKAEQIGSETLLSQIMKMVEEAQGSKPPIQNLADKISSIFVPVVMTLAVLAFCVWYYIMPEQSFQFAIQIFISVLVIACPCALGLATPTALIVGMGRGASQGILIRNGESLESVCDTDVLVLDKTGTITKGTPKVDDVIWINGNENEVNISILKSIENSSTHPLAHAIIAYFGADTVELDEFENHSGKGVSALVGNDKYHVGSLNFMKEMSVKISEESIREIQLLSEKGKSIVLFSKGEEAICIIAISDEIKQGVKGVIQKIKALGIKVIMLTGDNEKAAKYVATQLDLDSYYANVLPTEKGDFIAELQSGGAKVTMAGDGINDAHALAKADVGIAMASGSDIAKESAGITLLDSDLSQILRAIKLSKATLANIKQNLFFAFVYNLVAIPIAAGLLYPFFGILLSPMIAGGAMALSSVSVVTNSLRLKKVKID